MAKFCTKCGRPLAEGEICNCTSNTVEQTTQTVSTDENTNVVTESVVDNTIDSNGNNQINNVNTQTSTNATLEMTKNVLMDTWNVFLNVLKKPFSASKEYIMSNDNVPAFIFIFLQGILSGLLVLTVISRLFSELLGSLKSIANTAVDVNPFGNFLVGFLVSVALSFIYAAILFIVCMIFKSNTSYMVCVRATAIRSVALIVSTLLAIILGLMSVKIGIVVGLIVSPIVGFMFTLAAVRSFVNINDNVLVYALIVYVIISLVAYYIVAYKIGFYNIPLVREVKKGISGIGSLLSNTTKGSLSSLFN